MTDHRTLKRLVRERMARTGERYTTAHRHVVAQAAQAAQTGRPAQPVQVTRPGAPPAGRPAPGDEAPAAFPGLIPGPIPGLVPGYPTGGPTSHPPSALARAVLAHAGIAVSEPLACGLGGGIGFLYAVFEYREVSTPLLTIVAQHHPQPWLEAVAGHLDLPLTSVTSSRPGPALAKLDAVLETGRPAQVVVAAGHLPWRDPAGPAEAADPTAVVVAGRLGDDLLLDDGDGEIRPLGADAFAAAWAAHRKGRFAVTTLDHPATPPDLATGVRAALTTTHAHLTGPVLGHAFDANLGLRGIRRLAADLADTRTARGWTRRFGSGAAFAAGTARLAECLTSAYTAPGATRPLYAQFLAEAAELTGLPLDAAARSAAAAGDLWTEVADVAGGAGPDDDPPVVLARLAALVSHAAEVEERLAEQLGTVMGTSRPA